jgi:hypothetical protein
MSWQNERNQVGCVKYSVRTVYSISRPILPRFQSVTANIVVLYLTTRSKPGLDIGISLADGGSDALED